MSDFQLATRPLAGKRVLVTRTREQASVLSKGLLALGATPIEFPTIRIVPPTDWTQLDEALLRLCYIDDMRQKENFYRYDWVVFTSANGVNICMQRIQTLGYNLLDDFRIATIGPATAAALEQYGLSADLIPDAYVAEGVAEALIAEAQQLSISLEGQHILLARAAEARKVLAPILQNAGAIVDDVPAYYTRTAAVSDELGKELWQMLREHCLDILTFASSSTVRNFMAWLKQCEVATGQTLQPDELPTIACIGPITSQTARELGLTIAVEAQEFTISGLLEAIVAYEEKVS